MTTQMPYGRIPGVDKPVSRLVQGTIMVSSKDEDYGFKLLDDVFELGCNTFDTAHVYGNGDNERTVGKWIRSRGVREQVVIIGKGAHHNQDRRRVTPFDIAADIHDSLARFKTDYIDLYLLHRDDPSVPVGPIVEALNEHLRAGRIRAFGGSNWTHERIQAANEYARKHRLTPFVASSPHFSLAEQIKEPWPQCISISGPQGTEARAWYTQHQMPVFAWSSMAAGFWSGRFNRDNLHTFTDWQDRLCVECYCSEDNFKRLDRARALAAERGVYVPQIAMAYLFNQLMVVFALVGCRNREEFLVNMQAANLKLTSQEVAWLELRSDTR
ncbi:MAG: aldo/keto reductase [Anaerolineae bacterium]|nr:aldo/keto reductase [Thermoflexales bacterium]MDW8407152.1 aldo/keto reductase [Anaerolineae bacterium]